MNKWVLSMGATAGALVAMWGLWTMMGGAVPATREFVAHKVQKIERKAQELSKQSAHHGVEIYKSKLRGLLIMQPPATPEQRTIWQEIIDDTRKQQKFYEQEELRLHRR